MKQIAILIVMLASIARAQTYDVTLRVSHAESLLAAYNGAEILGRTTLDAPRSMLSGELKQMIRDGRVVDLPGNTDYRFTDLPVAVAPDGSVEGVGSQPWGSYRFAGVPDARGQIFILGEGNLAGMDFQFEGAGAEVTNRPDSHPVEPPVVTNAPAPPAPQPPVVTNAPAGTLLPSQVKWLTGRGPSCAKAKIVRALTDVSVKGDRCYFKTDRKITWAPKGSKGVNGIGILIRKIDGRYVGGKCEWLVSKRGWFDIRTNTRGGYNGHTMPKSGEVVWVAIANRSGSEISQIQPTRWP